MRSFLSLFLTFLVVCGIIFHDAEAKRFGGGRSFGMQRSSSTFSSRPQQPAGAAAMPGQRSAASRWLAPLAGLAAGGLLSYLLMSHGLGSGLMTWLAIAGIGFLIWNLVRSRFRTATQPSQYEQYRNSTNVRDINSANSNAAANPFSAPQQNNFFPAGFDSVSFLRDAKVQFMRLQAAYDAKNLPDLREFTAPEVFAEIQMQLQERGEENNQTEVVTLNAELLDVGNEFQATIASVHFSGLIRENPSNPAVPFNETWHFRKIGNELNWMVAGVQQQLN